MADADKNNAPVNVNESASIEDQLTDALDEIANILPQNGHGEGGESGDNGKNPDDGENANTDAEENNAGENDGEGGQTDTDDASADDDTAKAGEGEPSQEPVKPAGLSKEDRIKERKLAALEKALADSEGITIYEKIAEATGETEEEVKARIESDDLTTEEKAALYDAEHAKSKELELADAEKRGREAVLQALYADFPTIKDTVKDLDKDIKNPERFLQLLLAGNTPREAFLATGNSPYKNAPTPSGKSHLQTDVHSKSKGSATSLSAEEITTMRKLFPGMTDREIEQLRRRVN